MSNTPIGWQMISPTRHRARDIFAVTEHIRQLYPEAKDKHLIRDGSLVYLVPKPKQPQRVVALAWREESGAGWSYVVLPRASLELGVPCSVFKVADRVRVFPGVHQRPPPIETTPRRRSTGPRPTYSPRPPRVVGEHSGRRRRAPEPEPTDQVYVHQEGGKWVVTHEKDGQETVIGSFDSYGEACQHMPESV